MNEADNNVPDGYYRDSNGILKQKQDEQETHSIVLSILPSELSRLESMSQAELIGLVQRMACQCGLVVLMSDDEREQALFDVLATKGIKAMDVPAIKEYFDRKKGKPIQGIDQRLLGHMTISWED